jgi:mRNA-degrading endonuclease RelE of RelBE toxin-antitoxin system
MTWTVWFTGKAKKQIAKLPLALRRRLRALVEDLRTGGPHCPGWPNFGKISGSEDCFLCHLKKGRPTYVTVWRVRDQGLRVIEVRYVGTHEGVDYGGVY